MTRRLLDTNVWIHFLKDPSGKMANAIARLTPTEVVTCSIVRSELLHGAKKYGNPVARESKVRSLLTGIYSFAFDDAAAEHYANIRHELQKAGSVIGPYDLQIAAICLTHNLILATGNVKEFNRVPKLIVEDWDPAAI